MSSLKQAFIERMTEKEYRYGTAASRVRLPGLTLGLSVTFDTKQVVGRLKKIKARTADSSSLITEAVAKRLTRECRLSAPVDTGKLRKSIKYRVIRLSRGRLGVGYVGIDEDSKAKRYAAIVEYGSPYSKPSPFMRPGFQRMRRHMARISASIMSALIRRS